MDSETSSSDIISENINSSSTTEAFPSSDLKILENRLRTFENFPLTWLSKESLARAGFFYINIGDQVKCAFCNGVIGQWEPNDQPIEEHRKFFPECSVVRAIDSDVEEQQGIQTVRTPKSPEYSTLDSRLRSYGNWDSTVQDPRTLSQAGFYFLGTGDEVRKKKSKYFVPRQHVDINKISIFRYDAFIVTAG